MCALKTFATFEADFPDDIVWSASGEIRVPAGKGLTEVIAGMLRAQGLTVPEIWMRDYYGWEFEAAGLGGLLHVVIQMSDTWLLIAEPAKPGLIARLRGKPAVFPAQEVLSGLEAAMRDDGRFAAIRWFTREEFDRS